MVRAGERYRHYKGKVVEVETVAIAPTNALKGQEIWIDVVATDDVKGGEKIVVYSEMDICIPRWARPLRIFEAVLGKTTRFYRFEKIA